MSSCMGQQTGSYSGLLTCLPFCISSPRTHNQAGTMSYEQASSVQAAFTQLDRVFLLLSHLRHKAHDPLVQLQPVRPAIDQHLARLHAICPRFAAEHIEQ